MNTSYIFDRLLELKDKFKRFFVQRKKLQSLKNFSEATDFEHKPYLKLIDKCMQDGFLGEKEDDFLGYLLDRYEINFLDWAHRTKWLKGEMKRIAARSPKKQESKPEIRMAEQLFLFDIDAVRSSTPHVPTELLGRSGFKQNSIRRSM